MRAPEPIAFFPQQRICEICIPVFSTPDIHAKFLSIVGKHERHFGFCLMFLTLEMDNLVLRRSVLVRLREFYTP